MIQVAIIAATLGAILALSWFGDWEERLIAGTLIIGLLLAPVVDDIQIAQVRPGMAILEAVILLICLVLALTRDRWWLLFLTAFQGISLTTHLIPLFVPNLMVWTAVTVRLEIWCLIILALAAGSLEARSAKAFKQGHPQ